MIYLNALFRNHFIIHSKKILLVLGIIWGTHGFTQNTVDEVSQQTLKKNSLNIQPGFFPPLIISESVSYDRSLYISKTGLDWRGKFTIGVAGTFGAGYVCQLLTYGFLKSNSTNNYT